MTPDQFKVYTYVKKNPNSQIKDVIKNTEFSEEFVTKFLNTNYFYRTTIKKDDVEFIYYMIKDKNVIAQHQIPKHHELHKAFWGVDL